MLKTYKYKLAPNKQQRLSLQRTLDTCREVWNMALEQRKYQRTHWTVQCRELTELKAGFPEYKQVHVHVLQNVVKKLQRSFERMWELGSGFPRFKSQKRYVPDSAETRLKKSMSAVGNTNALGKHWKLSEKTRALHRGNKSALGKRYKLSAEVCARRSASQLLRWSKIRAAKERACLFQ